jgi:hypothetical protein
MKYLKAKSNQVRNNKSGSAQIKSMQNTCLFENNIPEGFTVNNLRCKPEVPMITEIEPRREFTIGFMNWSTQSWVGECTFISSSGSRSVTGGHSQITPYGVN